MAKHATLIDPLAVFLTRHAAGRHPIPLVRTEFDVTIDGGLAQVNTLRVFRNMEEVSIEATMTFPVPVHAVVFDLEARIDGRVLKGRTQRRDQAREKYEDGIDRGKASVLHEEVLRGIHMLSVGNVAPGCEIEVVVRWSMPLTVVGERGSLRIPLTVGQVYGSSGLPDSDDIVTGGPLQNARLQVHCSDGDAVLAGGRLIENQATVPLNAPIDLSVPLWRPRELFGCAADGRRVTLQLAPTPMSETPLNVAILIDHSGSMSEACSIEDNPITKHEAVRRGLRQAVVRLQSGDVIDLWEFDHLPTHVGSAQAGDMATPIGGSSASAGKRFDVLIDKLAEPDGGTEIGEALSAVIEGSDARDVLLITDGKSYVLDVQGLAQSGRRFTVLLVGEDSLEANVGHLAALTGGQLFVLAGDSLAEAIVAALNSERAPFATPDTISAEHSRVEARRAGVSIEAEWSPSSSTHDEYGILDRGIAAVAASVLLPVLSPEEATKLAEAEGLVTHLTSFVLVDEEGKTVEDMAETRKVPISEPDALRFLSFECRSYFRDMSSVSREKRIAPRVPDLYSRHYALYASEDYSSISSESNEAGSLAALIDWSAAPNKLLAGDLSSLDPAVANFIMRTAVTVGMRQAVALLGIQPVILVLVLFAQLVANSNRSAARFVAAAARRHKFFDLTGGDEDLAAGLLEGRVLLGEMPSELLKEQALGERMVWMRARLAERLNHDAETGE